MCFFIICQDYCFTEDKSSNKSVCVFCSGLEELYFVKGIWDEELQIDTVHLQIDTGSFIV